MSNGGDVIEEVALGIDDVLRTTAIVHQLEDLTIDVAWLGVGRAQAPGKQGSGRWRAYRERT